MAEVFRTLTLRLRDSTWTIVFKSLIIVHLMIKEGQPNVTLRYLADSPSKLAISNFSDVQIQGANIRRYYNYLLSRAKAYRDTHLDWVREGKGRLKRQTVDKGLLRETESVQKQIHALLKCDLFSTDTENEITLTAFRLLTIDLLSLYHVMNEGTINVLERYFEMSKVDAERALSIYKTFSKQTNEVVAFLSMARQYENATRLEIPKLKHAPTSLTNSLEEYLNDPDFDVNRRQYLAQQEAKKGSKPKSSAKEPVNDFNKPSLNNASSSQPKPAQSATKPPEPKGPAPDLIDFFESIEQNQQPMAAQPQTQVPNLQAVPQYQFQQPPQFAGAQSQQQPPQFMGAQPQQQPPQFTGAQPQQQQAGQIDSTNPFASMIGQQNTQNFPSQGSEQFSMQSPTQQFGATSMQAQPQDQSSVFQQQQQQQQQQQHPTFTNGQASSQQGFGTAQQPPFSAPLQQQSFSTGQTQSSFNSQQKMPFSTGQSAPQATNPFRQSTMPQFPMSTSSTPFSSMSAPPSAIGQQSTNPFHRTPTGQTPMQSQSGGFSSPTTSTTLSVFSPQSVQSPQSFTSATSQPLRPMRTGTNPFARSSAAPSMPVPPTAALLAAQATGTNPFRQSAFVNQQTGQGWQTHQGTMGGLEKLDTVPVFPRPVGQAQFQGQPLQQQQQQPWP